MYSYLPKSQSHIRESKLNSVANEGDNAEISIAYWDEDDFYLNKDAWQELLTNTEVDPLFLSWKWLYEWWQLRKKNHIRELMIIAVYEDQKLIAVAPLYIEKDCYLKGFLSTSRLQLLGTRYSGNAGIRAEYMDFIVRTNRQEQGMLHLLEAIDKNNKWTELSLSDLDTSSKNFAILKTWINKKRWHGRIESEGYTYEVDSSESFDQYLMSLGKNTRLKLYNRRKLLEKMGRVEVEFINQNNRHKLFKLLNQWHLKRWKSLVFDINNKLFFDRVFDVSGKDFNLDHSCLLKLDGQPLSVLINAEREGRIYNIQLGFVEGFNKKIPLGILHIGYMLEHAFNQSKIHTVDFLEGGGQNSNYKSSIAKKSTRLESSRWFRGRSLQIVFRFYDRWLRK